MAKKKLPHNVKLINPYRASGHWYHPVRKHTGVDMKFRNGDILLSPITGQVVRVAKQNQMGKTMYVKHHSTGDIHVFSHNKVHLRGLGDEVKRLEELLITDNTGVASSAPHLHWEIITEKPINPEDEIMIRELFQFKGYNTNPIKRILWLYAKHNIDPKTGKQKEIPKPTWIATTKKKITNIINKYIPYRFIL